VKRRIPHVRNSSERTRLARAGSAVDDGRELHVVGGLIRPQLYTLAACTSKGVSGRRTFGGERFLAKGDFEHTLERFSYSARTHVLARGYRS